MSAVERVQAAIDKLSELRDARGYFEMGGYLCETLTIVEPTLDSREELTPITDDELIVTLHRTIDAQLAILREALRQSSDPLFKFPFTAYDRAAIALADAILGADS